MCAVLLAFTSLHFNVRHSTEFLIVTFNVRSSVKLTAIYINAYTRSPASIDPSGKRSSGNVWNSFHYQPVFERLIHMNRILECVRGLACTLTTLLDSFLEILSTYGRKNENDQKCTRNRNIKRNDRVRIISTSIFQILASCSDNAFRLLFILFPLRQQNMYHGYYQDSNWPSK